MGEGKRKEKGKGKGREGKARRGQAGREAGREGGRVRTVDAGSGSDSEAFVGGGVGGFCQSFIIHHFGAICKETEN